MKIRLSFVPLAAVVCLIPAAHALDITKANNTDALNTATSWVDGIVPGAADVTVFDGSITTIPLTSPLGGDLAWKGIRVGSVGGTRNTGGTAAIPYGVTVSNASSANTLTLGSDGIDMGSALQGLALFSKVTLAGDQTWNVANANTNGSAAGLSQNEDLTFLAQAAAVPFNLGGSTVTKNGAGTAAFSSGWTLSNGTFNVDAGVLHIQGGSSRLTTVNNTVTFNVNNGGILRFACQTGAGGVSTQINSPVHLNTGGILALFLNQTPALNLTGPLDVQGDSTLNVTGGAAVAGSFSGTLLGNANLTYANTSGNVSALLNMTGNNSGFTGNFIINGASGTRALRLSSATAGSAAATWTVNANNILQVHGVNVALGTLNGAGTVTNSAAGPATLTLGAGNFSGSVTDGATAAAPMGIIKTGPGIFRLTGPATFTGPIDIQAGTYTTSTSQSGAGAITLATGTSLGVETKTTPGSTLAASLTTVGGGGSEIFVETTNLGKPFLPPYVLTGNFSPGAGTAIGVRGIAIPSGTFTMIKYNGSLGGAGFAGLTLKLPFRTLGNLVNNTVNTSIDVNITGIESPKWNGNFGPDWNLDDGTGTGTANWRTLTSGTATKYIQSPANTDQVLFDDTAAGTGTVNLTATLTPVRMRVDNTAKTYIFTGSGNLSGGFELIKTGTGDLILANSGVNDYTGTNTITAGRLVIGDNLTAGSGSLGTGAVANSGNLVFNRPDDFDFPNTISGSGTLTQQGIGVTRLTAPLVAGSSVAINAGGLRLAGGGTTAMPILANGRLILEGASTLTGVLSGTGEIESTATGTKTLNGTVSNPFSGLLKVTGGTLALNMTTGLNAVSGDVLVESGTLSWTVPDQLAPTASVIVSGGSINTGNRADTIKNLTLSSIAGVSTFSGLTITDTLRITAGTHDAVNSAGTLSTHTVILNGNSNARFGTNSGNSTWIIGSGGLTMDNATIQFGNAGAAFFAQINLNADLSATGTNNLTRPNTLGPRVLDLQGANRTFSVVDGVTTVGVDIQNGGLIKTGAGRLQLDAAGNTYAGPTSVTGGEFALGFAGELPGTPVIDLAGAVFDVVAKAPAYLQPATQTLSGTGTVNGLIDAFGTLSPGTAVLPGNLDLNGTLVLNAGSTLTSRIQAAGTPQASRLTITGDLTIDPAAKLTLAALDASALPTGTILPIITYTGTWSGGTFVGLPAGGTITAGANTFSIKYNDTAGGVGAVTLTSGAATAPYDAWASAAGLSGADALRTADPDGDGANNQLEFALGTLPAPGTGSSSTPSSRTTVAVQTVSGAPRLTMTIPVRTGAVFTGATEKTADIDGVRYRIQGSTALGDWTLAITEVTPALAGSLPALPSGWTYRTFHTPGPVTTTTREFIRLKVE